MSQVSAEFIRHALLFLPFPNVVVKKDDTSGHWLREAAHETGHQIVDKAIVKENRYAIRSGFTVDCSDDVQVVLITGGTGFTAGDQAPEALLPLFDREVEGFGECSASSHFEEIGTSTLRSVPSRG